MFDPNVLPALKTLRVFDTHEATLAMIKTSKLAKRVTLVTSPPEDAVPARYAHPPLERRIPLKLPRGGEPPKPIAKKPVRKPVAKKRR